MRVNISRLHAVEQLLRLPDEVRDDRRRGHRLRQPGKRQRFQQVWVPAVRVWTQHRVATTASAEAIDWWKSAVTRARSHPVLRGRSSADPRRLADGTGGLHS